MIREHEPRVANEIVYMIRGNQINTNLLVSYAIVSYNLSFTLASIYAIIVFDTWLIILPSVLFGLTLTGISVSGARRTRRNLQQISCEQYYDLDGEVSYLIAGIVLSVLALGPLLVVFFAVRSA